MPSTTIPCLRYKEAPKAIDWLCEAFGFERHLVVPGENNTIAHAQLSYGDGMIMMGTARDDEHGQLVKTPAEIGGVGTQCVYMIVPDTDTHYEKAKATGATIVMDIRDEDHGGRGYGCKDLEGHLWYFGSYNPWADH